MLGTNKVLPFFIGNCPRISRMQWILHVPRHLVLWLHYNYVYIYARQIKNIKYGLHGHYSQRSRTEMVQFLPIPRRARCLCFGVREQSAVGSVCKYAKFRMRFRVFCLLGVGKILDITIKLSKLKK